MGIGDDTFIGDNDEYLGMFYATREGHVNIGDRLLQMKIEDSMPEIEFEEVESFGNRIVVDTEQLEDKEVNL